MAKKKKKSIVIPLLIIGLLLVGIYSLKLTADKKYREGNSFLSNHKYSQALNSYHTAEKLWPPLKKDTILKQNETSTQAIIEMYKDKPAVTVFLKDGISQADTDRLVADLQKLPDVKSVKLITKEDALRKYTETNKNEPQLLELVTKDILPASIDVYTVDIPTEEQQITIVNFAQKNSIVQQAIKQILPTPR